MTAPPGVLVLRAPGINCERETFHAFAVAGGAPEFVHIKKLLETPDQLDRFAILAVPGGFAYGDDIAAGRVLAQQMKYRLGDRLLHFVDRGGLVLGICNGFQVLVRLGLLPRSGGQLREEVSLTNNRSNHYECRWVTMKTLPSRCVFLPGGLTIRWPAAHAEGRLLPRDAAFGYYLRQEGYAAVVYVDERGEPTEDYPDNPNGSPGGLAGLTDQTGRVLGVMPHPDRAYLSHHMPDWHRHALETGALPADGDGMQLFRSMIEVAHAEG